MTLFLRRYWLHIAVLAVVSLAAWRGYVAVYERGARDERGLWLARENQALVAAVAERDKALADRNAAQRKADELAKLPAKVVTVVRANPSNCSLAKPTAAELRKQAAATNTAIRGSVP